MPKRPRRVITTTTWTCENSFLDIYFGDCLNVFKSLEFCSSDTLSIWLNTLNNFWLCHWYNVTLNMHVVFGSLVLSRNGNKNFKLHRTNWVCLILNLHHRTHISKEYWTLGLASCRTKGTPNYTTYMPCVQYS